MLVASLNCSSPDRAYLDTWMAGIAAELKTMQTGTWPERLVQASCCEPIKVVKVAPWWYQGNLPARDLQSLSLETEVTSEGEMLHAQVRVVSGRSLKPGA